MFKQLELMNAFTFQSSEKYLNSKINRNIQRRRRKNGFYLAIPEKKKKDHLDSSLMTIRQKLCEKRKTDKEPTLSIEIKSHK